MLRCYCTIFFSPSPSEERTGIVVSISHATDKLFWYKTDLFRSLITRLYLKEPRDGRQRAESAHIGGQMFPIAPPPKNKKTSCHSASFLLRFFFFFCAKLYAHFFFPGIIIRTLYIDNRIKIWMQQQPCHQVGVPSFFGVKEIYIVHRIKKGGGDAT